MFSNRRRSQKIGEVSKTELIVPEGKCELGTVQSFPPPPPPETPPASAGSLRRGEIHLPGTNIFRSIRSQLSALEKPPHFKSELEPFLAFLITLVFGAFVGLVVALGIDSAILAAVGPGGANAFYIIVAPLLEETIKGLCILAVAFALPRVFPNRRYSAAWGAATGLGFGAFASYVSLMTGKFEGGAAFVKVLVTPFANPLWSAFVGIGVFVFVTKWQTQKSFSEALSWLTFLFLLFGILNHMIWMGILVLIPDTVTGNIVALVVVFPVFAFLLRDLLGGHFNFNRFFEPLVETPPPPQTTS